MPRRRWSAQAAERILASLACVALVVEADDDAFELAGARIAQTLGRRVAAVPGRITSRASHGPHALLRDGASIVQCAEDVLDLLLDADRPAGERRERTQTYAGLEPRLREVLERVGAGADTVGRLLATGAEHGALLQALGELELTGLLARGDGGRYVPREPLEPRSCATVCAVRWIPDAPRAEAAREREPPTDDKG